MPQYLLPPLIAAFVALLLTPIVRILALRIGFVDHPDGQRKVHRKPVALGGGIAVLLASLLGSLLVVGDALRAGELAERNWNAWGLFAAAALLCIVGLFDDRRPIPGKYKLLWQVLASSLVIGSGLVIDKMSLFGTTVELGLLGVLLTMIWLLAAINSLNLIDGVDGLATSVGLIFSFTLGLMAFLHGHYFAAGVALSIAGGLLGFLPYNFPQAKIYLGDAGSMVLGLVLGTLALQCTFKEAATVAFAAPLALWAIPIFDSVVAIARRTLTGRSVYATDRGHFHHRLLTRGLSPWQALAIVAGLCTITSAGALASVYFQNEAIGLGVAGAVILALVATRIFGHVELILLNNVLLGIGRSWVPFSNNSSASRHTSVQIQGTLAWETLWLALVESSSRFGLCQMTLNLHAPQLHEDFYATWKRRERFDPQAGWQINIPIRVGEEVTGRLRVTGEPTWQNVPEQLQQFLDFVEVLQLDAADLIPAAPQSLQPRVLPAPSPEDLPSSGAKKSDTKTDAQTTVKTAG